MLLFKAFCLNTTDLAAVEEALDSIVKRLQAKCKRNYALLAAQEIEDVVDSVSLNMIQRPNISLYDAATQQLDGKINFAIGNRLPIPYNFGAHAYVYMYNGKTYIKLYSGYATLVSELKPVGDMSDCSVYDEAPGEPAGRADARAVWDGIMQEYGNGRAPLFRQISPVGDIKPDWDLIAKRLRPREKRVDERALHQVTSTLFNMFGFGQEVPPYRLMPVMYSALSMMEDPNVREEIQQTKQRLLPILPTITEGMVKYDPSAPMPSAEDETRAAET